MDLEFSEAAEVQPKPIVKKEKKVKEWPSFFEVMTRDAEVDSFGSPAKCKPILKRHYYDFFDAKNQADAIVRSELLQRVPTRAGLETARSEYDQLKDGLKTTSQIMQTVRQELARVFDLPEGTGVFLATAEDESTPVPFLIARCLNPEAT